MILPDIAKPLAEQSRQALLRMLLWGEARGEGPMGMLCVGCVALNRAEGRGLPLERVILAPLQFSSFNLNDPNRAPMLTPLRSDLPAVWGQADAVAELLENKACVDPTGGADHYCAALDGSGKPLWGRPDTVTGGLWFEASQIAAGRTVEKLRWGRHVFATAP